MNMFIEKDPPENYCRTGQAVFLRHENFRFSIATPPGSTSSVAQFEQECDLR